MTNLFSGFVARVTISPGNSARLARMRPMMGTLCTIEAMGDNVDLEDAVNRAYGAFCLINELMHPQRGVDLSRINQTTGKLLQVHELTWQVLHFAKQCYEGSQGVFDPCLPTRDGSVCDIELLPDNKMICHAPVSMDLGGIAKGFAVDLAIQHLQSAGCSSAVVNAGGDVRVFGEEQIMHVQHAEATLSVELNNQALAVSKCDHADRPAEHRGYYRRHSDSSSQHESKYQPKYQHIAVMAETAVIADALTKCVMWLDHDADRSWFEALNAKVLLTEAAPSAHTNSD